MPSRQTPYLPICPLFDKPVALETSQRNKDGKAVHEDCHVIRVAAPRAKKQNPQTRRRRKTRQSKFQIKPVETRIQDYPAMMSRSSRENLVAEAKLGAERKSARKKRRKSQKRVRLS
jgi:hypothetical protein